METFITLYEEKIKSVFVEKTDDILENAFLVVLAMYLFRIFIVGTTLGVSLPGEFEWVLRVLAAGIGILRVQRSQKKNKMEYFLLFLFTIGFTIPYIKTGYTFLLDYSVFILGCFRIDYKKILKVYLVVGGTILAAAVFATFIGTATDIVYIRDYEKVETTSKIFNKIYGKLHLPVQGEENIVRHSMGVMYCTDFGAWCFSLALVLWIYLEELPSILFAPVFVLLSYMVHTVAGARNVAAMFLVAAVLAAIGSIMELLKKISIFRSILNFLCASVASVVAPICLGGVMYVLYKVHDEEVINLLDRLLSGRLRYSHKMLERYGITWLGSVFDMVGFGGNNQATRVEYTFIDISYVLMVVRYGILFTGLLLILYMIIGIRGSKITNYRIPMTAALFAAQGIVEHHMVEPAYVILLLLPLAAFEGVDQQKKDWKALGKMYGYRLVIVLAVGGLSWLALSNREIYRVLFASGEEIFSFVDFVFLLVGLLVAAGLLLRRKKSWWLAALCLGMTLPVLLVPGILVQNQTLEYGKELLESTIFHTLLEEKDSLGYRVYGGADTYLLQKEGYSVDSSLMTGDGYAGYQEAVILCPRDQDMYVLNKAGYQYVGMTEHYSLYANAEDAITLLQRQGCEVSPVYNERKEVDFDAQQSFSVVPRSVKGDIIMDADNDVIFFGPLEVVSGGVKRKVQVDIQLNKDSFIQIDDKPVAKVSIVTMNEKKRIGSRKYKADTILEEGVLSITCGRYYEDDYYVKVEALNGNSFHIKNVTYFKYE